jgi:hypothetical protein
MGKLLFVLYATLVVFTTTVFKTGEKVNRVERDMTTGSGSSQDAVQSSSGSSETGEVCIPNISTRERRKRLASGVIMFVISLAFLAALMAGGASSWWRLVLFLPFAGAASGFFQWRDKT